MNKEKTKHPLAGNLQIGLKAMFQCKALISKGVLTGASVKMSCNKLLIVDAPFFPTFISAHCIEIIVKETRNMERVKVVANL